MRELSAPLACTLLWGSPECRVTLRQVLLGKLLQHISAGVVFVVGAGLTRVARGSPFAQHLWCKFSGFRGSLTWTFREDVQLATTMHRQRRCRYGGGFHDCPLEERGVFGGSGVNVLPGGLVENAYLCFPAETDPPFVNPAPQPLIGTAIDGDRSPPPAAAARSSSARRCWSRASICSTRALSSGWRWRVLSSIRSLTRRLRTPKPRASASDTGQGATQIAHCRRLRASPGLQVGVESPNGAQDRLELTASLAVCPDRSLLTPPPVKSAVDTQIRLAGGKFLDHRPEMAGQVPGKVVQRRVIQLGLAALQVADQQLPNAGVADR